MEETMKQYIFLLGVDPISLTQDNVIALGSEWKKLITDWSAKGIFIALYRFNLPGNYISGKTPSIILENYFNEHGAALTGCVILLAINIQDATEISRSFPTLSIGGSVEIREIQADNIIK